MPSISRPLADESLHFATMEEVDRLRASEAYIRTGRSARTLVKDGQLRVTLVALGAGAVIPMHSSAGPITIHVLTGEIGLEVGEKKWALATGDILAVGGGVGHEVTSTEGGVFLLTVANPAD